MAEKLLPVETPSLLAFSAFFENYQEKATSGTAGGFECQDVLSGGAGESYALCYFSTVTIFYYIYILCVKFYIIYKAAD